MSSTLTSYPTDAVALPTFSLTSGKYRVRMASCREELETVLRLRYAVFNLEMGEGLAVSSLTGMDEDRYDEGCHHLLIEQLSSGAIIGTYRIQTTAMAAAHCGWYSASEFDLSGMPDELLRQAIEVGRACIHHKHRNGRVLFLLWQGLAKYMKAVEARYLFGCCSLTSQNPEDGLMMLEHLEASGQMHPSIRLQPLAGHTCVIPENEVRSFPKASVPRLMRIYLNYRATICSEPAIDRLFKTIDFLTLMDVHEMESGMYANLFG